MRRVGSHIFPDPQNSARAGEAAGRPSQGEKSMAAPNIPDRAEALEAADNGHGQELAMWNTTVGYASLPEPTPLDPKLAELVAKDIAEFRERLMDDMKMLDANRDQRGAAELHLMAGNVVNEIDDMAAVLRRELDS